MNSRERVKAVLNHQPADRIPVDFGGTRGTSCNADAYINVRKELGLPAGRPYVNDFVQQLAYPDRDILEHFKIDIIDGGQAFRQPEEECRIWKLNSGAEAFVPGHFDYGDPVGGRVFVKDPTGSEIVGVKDPHALYFTQNYWAYQNEASVPEDIAIEDLGKNIYGIPIHPWNLNLENESEYERFVSGIKKLYEETDYAIALTIGCQIFEMGQYVRGMENFMMDMYTDERGAGRLLDRLLEKYMTLLEKVCAGVGNYVETLRFVDDLGSQQAPLINPEKYRDFIKPYHRTMWDYVHSNSNCKVTLHSCGSIRSFLPDLIDAGLDILNPVQITSAGMDAESLKKEFGKDLIFWGGGCDTQDILPNAEPEEVKEHVKGQIEALGHDGGMIFAQIHNIQADVPAANIIAMLEAAHEYGKL